MIWREQCRVEIASFLDHLRAIEDGEAVLGLHPAVYLNVTPHTFARNAWRRDHSDFVDGFKLRQDTLDVGQVGYPRDVAAATTIVEEAEDRVGQITMTVVVGRKVAEEFLVLAEVGAQSHLARRHGHGEVADDHVISSNPRPAGGRLTESRRSGGIAGVGGKRG